MQGKEIKDKQWLALTEALLLQELQNIEHNEWVDMHFPEWLRPSLHKPFYNTKEEINKILTNE